MSQNAALTAPALMAPGPCVHIQALVRMLHDSKIDVWAEHEEQGCVTVACHRCQEAYEMSLLPEVPEQPLPEPPAQGAKGNRMTTTTDTALPPFIAFPKIPRLRREIIITEKLDGTNASVTVLEDGRVLAGSRSRWITPKDDNFGFAKWVLEHENELRVGLGFGTHYGEWWGAGIQRGYGLQKGGKRFSLFNVHRWTDDVRPACCHVVPTLYRGPNEEHEITHCIETLREHGSMAARSFMQPEGIVVFHTASGGLFKVTLEKDSEPKGAG